MGIIALVVVATIIVAMVVVFLVKKKKEGKMETKPKEEPEKPSVVQEPSKPEKNICEGCNNFEACIDCDNGSRWAHIVVPKEVPYIKEGFWYMCINDFKDTFGYKLFLKGELYMSPADNFLIDKDGNRQVFGNAFKYFRQATDSEIPKEEEQEEKIPFDVFKPFSSIVDIKEGTKTDDYLYELANEAWYQFYEGKSIHCLPTIIKQDNFPNIYDFFGEAGDEDAAFKTLVGWLLAMQLAELRPQDRTEIFKIGYEIGGYTKDSNLYGYRFEFDPNVLRLSAAAIWSAMRGVCKPDTEAMRKECGGIVMAKVNDIRKFADCFSVGSYDSFYVDLREFLPTAPGPYATNYKDRSAIGGYPYPNDAKTDDYNLAIDRAIRDMIVEKYNLGYDEWNIERPYEPRTVQAIADKDANYNHLFGKSRQVDEYHFDPVFTKETLGQEVYPSLAKDLCSLVDDVLNIGSAQRCILQGHEGQENPPQYGRLRPGCSWHVEAHRHSDTDDTQNVLVDFYIEDNDGNPTGYYNADGEWVNKDGIHSPEEYNDVMKDELWANSYPSGHSAAISSTAMLLIELLPKQADKILAAANRFAVNRTIARYHWNSDTIQGRVLATCVAPIIRCCSDWNERFEKAKDCLK